MAQVDERHRAAQVTLRAGTVRDALALWRGVNPDRFDDTFGVVADALWLLVGRDRPRSTALADDYYRQLRAQADTVGAVPDVTAGPLDRDLFDTSMRTVGPVQFGQSLRAGAPPAEAARRTFVTTSGAVTRHVLNGGRETIVAKLSAEPRRVRWRRITAPGACRFCTMLAGRGAVYTADTVGFQAHDACACMPAPQF